MALAGVVAEQGKRGLDMLMRAVSTNTLSLVPA